MTVVGYQLLVALTVLGAGVWDAARPDQPPIRWFKTARNPVALGWLGWTAVMVFIPWLMWVQLGVLALSYGAASAIVFASSFRSRRKLSTVELAIGCPLAALAAVVLTVALVAAGVVIYAIQTWEEPCSARSTPMVPDPCDENPRGNAETSSTATRPEASEATSTSQPTGIAPSRTEAQVLLPDGATVIYPLSGVSLVNGGGPAWTIDAEAPGSDLEPWLQPVLARFRAAGYRVDASTPPPTEESYSFVGVGDVWTVDVNLNRYLDGIEGRGGPIVLIQYLFKAT